MIKQIVNGKTYRTVRADMTEAVATEVKALLAGALQTFDKAAEGGSSAVTPGNLNRIVFSATKQVSANTRKGRAIYVNHMNPAKNNVDLYPLVEGQFDVDYDDSTKAEKMNIHYDSSKG